MRIKHVRGTNPHPPTNAQVGPVLRLIFKAHRTSEQPLFTSAAMKLQSLFTEADIVAL
ncbi:hypothetical protein QJS04_geneDACA021123 [Acorus gramineus]|uniref:Uncharacterized protein n=1 Tax=Acorus gramineus TaxID=55184 RepID=A0AAV9BKG1_ACOGR|nr:hypothetical protein QJS04_geneDACA021123 [Acorus gramineus]